MAVAPQNVAVKNFENRLLFGEDIDKNLRLTFFGPCCIHIRTLCITETNKCTFDFFSSFQEVLPWPLDVLDCIILVIY